jgi:hypothetical protein
MILHKLLALLLAVVLVSSLGGAVTYTAITSITSLDNENDYARAPASWATLLGNGSVNYYAWPAGYDLMVGFNFTSTYNSTLDHFDIMKGSGFRSSIGNYSFNSPAAGVYWFGPLESARFKNGTSYLQISSGYMVGKVSVFKVKR